MLKKPLRTLWKILLVSMAVLVGLLLFLIICFTDTDVVTSSKSESGDYEIIIEADHPLTFGNHTVYVYGKENNSPKKLLFSTELANDGKALGEENVIIKWNGNKAIITLKGEEQEDEIRQVEFTSTKIEVRDMETK
ncbi:hypothetical protein HNQ85_001838 [Anoxybacillus calidus]|jgi:hypothetical protein|uniref:Uncharacterized protein n=1 Tax=[Anoxybacillus] calidus TaxID=575178 RepID=A0A7W0BV78_9BACL|nr:hypothetical protein [Anoxybacillus calidus]MBA2871568.1 hypothetical protein [Anoxybacillus calidus]